jgi:hypothetical protein
VDIGGPGIMGYMSLRLCCVPISCTGVLQARCFTPTKISPTIVSFTAHKPVVSIDRPPSKGRARTQKPVRKRQALNRLRLAADIHEVVVGQQSVAPREGAPGWAPVRASAWAPVRASAWAPVRAPTWAPVRAST